MREANNKTLGGSTRHSTAAHKVELTNHCELIITFIFIVFVSSILVQLCPFKFAKGGCLILVFFCIIAVELDMIFMGAD